MISPSRLHAEQLVEFKEKIRRIEDPMKGRADRQVRRLLMHLFAGTAGGFTRLRMVMVLLESPCNTRQLALAVGLDYKAVQRHLQVMQKNSLVSKTGGGYGVVFRVSDLLEHNIRTLDEVIEKLVVRSKARKVYY